MIKEILKASITFWISPILFFIFTMLALSGLITEHTVVPDFLSSIVDTLYSDILIITKVIIFTIFLMFIFVIQKIIINKRINSLLTKASSLILYFLSSTFYFLSGSFLAYPPTFHLVDLLTPELHTGECIITAFLLLAAGVASSSFVRFHIQSKSHD